MILNFAYLPTFDGVVVVEFKFDIIGSHKFQAGSLVWNFTKL